jgi:glycosyltransferase involved in cell wall biosynthesis
MYHNLSTVGSQSGSVRELMAAGVIPIVTKSNEQVMHNDICAKSCAIGINNKDQSRVEVGAFTSGAINIIHKYSSQVEILDNLRSNMRQYCSEYSFENAAKKHIEIYKEINT